MRLLRTLLPALGALLAAALVPVLGALLAAALFPGTAGAVSLTVIPGKAQRAQAAGGRGWSLTFSTPDRLPAQGSPRIGIAVTRAAPR